ncbi:unnamed protein product [Meganyctiphanes norvegica]|uniref:Gustatory receptor n=1 Tax=Meganyctiphanes norvegica TaxID=48144 RepID=A0AAV2R416_MEGNR
MFRGRTSRSSVIMFLTVFIAAGGRVLVCCLMAVSALYDPEIDPFLTLETGRIVLPVASAIGVQLILGLAHFCLSCCGRNFISQTCSWTKTNVDSSEYSAGFMQTKSTEDSFRFTLATIRNRSSPGQLLNIIYKVAGGLGSILISVTTDAHSLLGLYSSAVYATWAVGSKIRFSVYDSFIETSIPVLASNLLTTGITLTMLSYTVNTVMVLMEGRYRYMSLVVSLMFMILPAYAYNLAALGNTDALQKLLFNQHYRERHINATIAVLNAIVTMAGLIISLNIITIVVAKVKARKK